MNNKLSGGIFQTLPPYASIMPPLSGGSGSKKQAKKEMPPSVKPFICNELRNLWRQWKHILPPLRAYARLKERAQAHAYTQEVANIPPLPPFPEN